MEGKRNLIEIDLAIRLRKENKLITKQGVWLLRQHAVQMIGFEQGKLTLNSVLCSREPFKPWSPSIKLKLLNTITVSVTS